MAEQARGNTPAFYARRGGPAADWWTVLHPPYTLWHLGYVLLGAAVAPRTDWQILAASVGAFFLAVGVAAHALDELRGRPLRTRLSDLTLWTAAGFALAGAAGLGVLGAVTGGPTNWVLLCAIPVGVVLVVGYNLELLGGRMHSDLVFALAWGGFPVVVGYVAQRPAVSLAGVAAVLAATAAGAGTAHAQRRLSTPARHLRRRVRQVQGTLTGADGTVRPLTRERLLDPLEGALRALSWAVPLLAVAVLLGRL